jgi:hypothetical protein
MNVNGKMIFRHVTAEDKLPKGKKAILVVGVLVADADVPDNHVIDMDGPLDLGNAPIPMNPKLNGWNMDDLVTEFDWNGVKLESTRHDEFHQLVNKALKMVSHSTGTNEERKAMAELIRERAKDLPELDIVKEIIGSIVAVLTGKE